MPVPDHLEPKPHERRTVHGDTVVSIVSLDHRAQPPITAGVSRVASGPRCLHAVATTPAGPRNPFARTVPSASAFPEVQVGWLLHCPFRGCSAFTRVTACMLTESPCDPFTEGCSSFVTSTAASGVTGRNEPAPGRDFHPLLTSAFPRRTGPCGQPYYLTANTVASVSAPTRGL
jgi:hypothetical protein